MGDGDGTFEGAVNYNVAHMEFMAVGDFNGDGKTDLAGVSSGSNNVAVLLGMGDGTFSDAFLYGVGHGPNSLTAGDFNGDGKTDLATVNYYSHNLSILLNTTTESSYVLTVSKTGTGSGAIKSSLSSFDCEADCSYIYNEDTIVTLTAMSDKDSLFTGWAGDCSACGINAACNITLNGDKTCTAIFNLALPPNYCILEVSKTGIGDGVITSTPTGINCCMDCSETYLKATQANNLKLKITPNEYSLPRMGCRLSGERNKDDLYR